jgi:hypothetical protein
MHTKENENKVVNISLPSPSLVIIWEGLMFLETPQSWGNGKRGHPTLEPLSRPCSEPRTSAEGTFM